MTPKIFFFTEIVSIKLHILSQSSMLRVFVFIGIDVIKYAHNTYDGRTRKIPSEDTIILLPEEKANSCQHDSEYWRVPGACACIVIDDGVTSMMNAFDRDNAMLGKINFFENLSFLTIDD